MTFMKRPTKTIQKRYSHMIAQRPTRMKGPATDFLDLGSGPAAEKGSKLADNRKQGKRQGRFVSVDLFKDVRTTTKTGRIAGQPQHFFVVADALNYLKRQKSNSVKVINSTHAFDMFIHAAPDVTNTGAKKIESIKKIFREYCKHMLRVLVPNGRVFLGIGGPFANLLIRELTNAGFQVLSQRATPPRPESLFRERMLREKALERLKKYDSKPKSDSYYYELLGFRGFPHDVGIYLRAYPIRPVALQVMMLHARCSMPM